MSDPVDKSLRYRAFISYSHQDERWASWLHKALERYRVPRHLVGKQTAAGIVPRRLAPIFRDREELASATSLSRVVDAALGESASLVVICSPAAAASPWVGEEIRSFRRLGRGDRVFCLIVDGVPESPGADRCFPAALTEVSPSNEPGLEPVGADVRPGKDRPHAALLKLVAGMLDVGLDELVRRDLQRRNRRLVAITAAALAGMTVAAVLAALALVARNEAERQRTRAETEAATAQQTSEFLVNLFQVVDPSEARGATVTAREILERGALRIDHDLASQPFVRANLLQTMGRVYTGLGLYQEATDLLKKAFALREDLARSPTLEGVTTANALGAALYLKGEYEAAARVYDDALRAAETLFPDGHPLVTAALNGIAEVLIRQGDYATAQTRYETALAMDRRLHGNEHPDVARTLCGLAEVLFYERRSDESEADFRECLAIRERTLGDGDPLIPYTLNNLASVLYVSGRGSDAEPLFGQALDRYRAILGEEHPFVSSLMNNIGRLQLERGDFAGAEEMLSRGLAIDRKLKDPGHDDFIYTLNNLGLAELGLGKPEAALPALEEALKIAEAHSHPMLGPVLATLADCYWRVRRAREAVATIERARPVLAKDYPSDPWRMAELASIEGAARLALGELDRGRALLTGSQAAISAHWGADGGITRLAQARAAALDAVEPARPRAPVPTRPAR